MFDIEAGQWSTELCALFGVPPHALPEVVASTGVVGHTDPDAFLGLSVPVAGIAGDQQAALFGQACFEAGAAKCTYGTGSFVLVNTGPDGGQVGRRAAVDRGLAVAVGGADLRTRGIGVRHRRRHPVAAGRPRAARRRGPERGTRALGSGLRRGRVRPGANRPRRAGLGSRCSRCDVRPHAGHHAGSPDQGGAGSDRVRGPGRDRCDDGGVSHPGRGHQQLAGRGPELSRRCGSTAEPVPTTCSCSFRRIRSSARSSGL